MWFPEPAPPTHPWRRLGDRGALTVHYSGATLDAQRRFSEGVQTMLQCVLTGQNLPEPFLIVDKGVLVSSSYTEGDSTTGVDELEGGGGDGEAGRKKPFK